MISVGPYKMDQKSSRVTLYSCSFGFGSKNDSIMGLSSMHLLLRRNKLVDREAQALYKLGLSLAEDLPGG